jgi:hypothetical protein
MEAGELAGTTAPSREAVGSTDGRSSRFRWRACNNVAFAALRQLPLERNVYRSPGIVEDSDDEASEA